MITLCIRYTLDPHKLTDFEAYARALGPQIERCGGKVAGYYLPTKLAGPTNSALGLIDLSTWPPMSAIAKIWRPIPRRPRTCAAPRRPAVSLAKIGPSSVS